MTERQENDIIFTPNEQIEFGVPERTTAHDAVRIADGFTQAGIRLIERNLGIDDTDRVQGIAKQKRIARAGRLSSLAAGINRLCPDEEIQLLLEKADTK